MQAVASLAALGVVAACGLASARAETTMTTYELREPLTGKLGAPAALNVLKANDASVTYSVRIGGAWMKGRWRGSGIDGLHALLLDMDGDGHADLWITGDQEAQSRARASDIWRFDPVKKQYVFAHAVSALPNLEFDTMIGVLGSGVSNCGCAARCFFQDEFKWRRERLQQRSHKKQDCAGDKIVYEEWSLDGRGQRVTTRETGAWNEKKDEERREGALHPIDWRSFGPDGKRRAE